MTCRNGDVCPVVWYIAAGYLLPAGIEAYLLHYATEVRKQGFNTRILVFQPLPKVEHRFLSSLRERNIPIESLYKNCAWDVWMAMSVTWLPWSLVQWLRGRQWPDWRALHTFYRKHFAVRMLERRIRRETPDIIHVKGRTIAEVWPILPSDRTIYQHALMGTVDPSWTRPEVDAFRLFLNRIAKIFVQGRSIAETMKREFALNRDIDVVPTMCPDENGGRKTEDGGQRTSDCRTGAELRFGILCRFTEQKGISYILEALRMFHNEYGRICFTFAGMGPLEILIRNTVDREQWTDVNIVRVESATEVLKQMDVFVHPGLDDAMPVSIVEALMCGVPCIGSNVGGVPDLIREGREGLLVEPRSAEGILHAMARFASMEADEIDGYRQRARLRYEEVCHPDKVARTVASHYRGIMCS